MYVRALYVCLVPFEAKEGIRSPGAGVIYGYKQPFWAPGTKFRASAKAVSALTAEPSVQLSKHLSKLLFLFYFVLLFVLFCFAFSIFFKTGLLCVALEPVLQLAL